MLIRENIKGTLATIIFRKLSNTHKFILQSHTKQEKIKKIPPISEEEKKRVEMVGLLYMRLRID